jgi:hypothetical protein
MPSTQARHRPVVFPAGTIETRPGGAAAKEGGGGKGAQQGGGRGGPHPRLVAQEVCQLAYVVHAEFVNEALRGAGGQRFGATALAAAGAYAYQG